MKQIFMSSNGRVVKDAPMPVIGDKEVLVRVHSSVISTGTETSTDRNKKTGVAEKKELLDKVLKMISEKGLSATYDRIRKQLTATEKNILLSPIGYSNAGVVVGKGRLVDGFNVGDRVACCGAGIASHAEYVAVPINMAAKLPDNVAYADGAFATIGSIAMQGLRRSGVSFGETVVITGLGLLGLIAVQIAKAWGLVVVGIDLNEERTKLAKQMGADACFNAGDADLVDKVNRFTNGVGADAVVIYAATKSSGPVNQAFDMCRKRGTVVAVGAVGMELVRDKMYQKELNFLISTSYGPGRYDDNYEQNGNDYPIGFVRWTENRNLQEFVRLLSVGGVKVEGLISQQYSIIDAVSAFQSLVEDRSKIACVINYPFEESHDQQKDVTVIDGREHAKVKGKVNVGVIGAGGFVKARHLKNMRKLSDYYNIVAICNHTPGSSMAEGENWGAAYVTTDYNKLLADESIDLVVIGTRHNLHGELVVKCIEAGKNVLVEKPMAMTIAETEAIAAALKKSNVRVYVGYNRRYSPAVQSIKSHLSDNNPMVVNYRINAGKIDKSSWVQSLEIGGGRLIGEGCHFIDLISFICGGTVVSASIEHVPVSAESPCEDNFIVTLKYNNGNIGVLTYTSLGGSSMPKEQLEVFCGEKAFVCDDFLKLKEYDNAGMKETVLKEQDKGHYRLIEEIAKDLTGKDNIIAPFSLDFDSSELAIHLFDTMGGRTE